MSLTAYATPRELAVENADQGFVRVTDERDREVMPATDCETFEDQPWTSDLADVALTTAGLVRTQPWETGPDGRLHADVAPQLVEGLTTVRYVVQQRDTNGPHSDCRSFTHPGPALAYLQEFSPVDDSLRIVRRTETRLIPHS